jgi:hypothetical protein
MGAALKVYQRLPTLATRRVRSTFFYRKVSRTADGRSSGTTLTTLEQRVKPEDGMLIETTTVFLLPGIYHVDVAIASLSVLA